MPKLEKQGNSYSFRPYVNGQQIRVDTGEEDYQKAKIFHNDYMSQLHQKKNRKIKKCEDFIREYLINSKLDKAARTYKSEKQAIEHFCEIIQLPTYMHEVKYEQHLRPYKQHEIERGQSTNSINSKFIRIKSLFNSAERKGYIIENPSKELKYIKKGRRLPRHLSIEEKQKFVNAETKRDIYYLANLVAIYTGFRPDEVLWINKRTDINWEVNKIFVNPKLGFEPKDYELRGVPIKDKLAIVIKELDALAPNSEWLITDYTGQRPSYYNFTQSTAKVFRRLEINIKNATMYTMRHTFAFTLSMRGESIMVIKYLLGHADVSTTMIYTEVAPSEITQKTVDLLDY